MPLRRLLLALATLALLAPPATAQVVQITSNISANTTWGPTGTVVGTVFWVRNSIAVNAGATLNIQPGVVVKFDSFRGLTVNGSLRCIGTPAQNVFFTSYRDDNLGGDTNGDGNASQPAANDWVGISWPDASPDFGSRFDYCDVRFAGAGSNAALTFTSSSDTVSNSFVRRSYFGVDCAGTAAPVLSNTSIEASTQTPIVLDFTAAPVLSSLVFSSSNNGYDAFGLRGGTLATSASLPRRGATVGANPITNVTYVLLNSITVNPGVTLTIQPGVVIKPVSGYSITVNGSLVMNGTAAVGDTIVVTSIHDDNFGNPPDTNNNGSITAPNRGDWNRINFTTTGTGSISRVRLRFGTNSNSQGLIETDNTTVNVQNAILSEASHGLAIFGVATPAITNVAINNCSSTPILMSVSANPTFSGVTFLANAVTALGIQGESVAADSRLALRSLAGYTNITYYIMNGILRMLNPAVLRIDPGVVIKNQISGGGLQIEGALVADAKPESLIVFTSERDDLFGNPPDTNGDGSTTTPGVANWTFIRFMPTSNDAVSKLDYCRILYGSYNAFSTSLPAAVWMTSAAAPITNCFISRASYGITLDGDSSPLISACDINNCTNAPIAMSALSDPNIATNNTYSTNGYNALALLSETLSGNARLKYRPGVGTPTFAYLPTGTITVPTGVTLTVDPQVVLKPTSAFTMFDIAGALNMVGSNSTTGRIVVTSRRDDNPIYGGDTTPNDASTPQTGDWGQIRFTDTAVDPQCVVRNVLFQFGGSSNTFGVIETNSAGPKLARLEFFQNGTAFTITGASTPSADSVSILNCTQLPIVASLVSNPTWANITFANNRYLAYGILGETIAQDVRTRVRPIGGYSNLNYAPASTITIAFGAKWTIDPGVVIKFGSIFSDPIGTFVQIEGALVADGKPDSLIVFTASTDDAFGQDVRGDGAATLPTPGQWSGFRFTGISNDVVTVVDNCLFRYGSYSLPMLGIENAGPTITNSRFVLGSGQAISIEGASTPTFTNCFVDSTDSGPPVFMSLVSEPVFNNVQFLGNKYTALGVISENIAQDVLWKIRAVSGRNNMPYYMNGATTIGLGATLTIQPGVIAKFNGGSINAQRAIQAIGRTDPESLIVFTSIRDDFYGGDTNNDSTATSPTANQWSYIQVDATAIDPQCVFRNCVVRYAQYGFRCVSSAPTIDSCLVQFNGSGIRAEGASNPLVRGCTIVGNTNFGVENAGGSFCVSAEGCWWGAANGPSDASATADLCGLTTNAGSGDVVSNNVDYLPYAATGIVTPLIGDVSLNGRVLAFDASLILQHLVSAVSLNPLQLLVADVTGTAGVSSLDASLILQYVAGIIPSFPVSSNRVGRAPEPAVIAALDRTRGTFDLTLGDPRRDGADWLVPVRATGSAPVLAVDLVLDGRSASSLASVEPAGGALHAVRAAEGVARVALASATAFATDEVATLRFTGAGERFERPRIASARVNEQAIGSPIVVESPAHTAFAAPAPNPAKGPTKLSLAISAADAGLAADVRVVDVTGRTVRTLVNGPLSAGTHAWTWDLADDEGRPVRPGLYFVRASTRSQNAAHRLIVVR